MIASPHPCPGCQKTILLCGVQSDRPVPCPHCKSLLQINSGAIQIFRLAAPPPPAPRRRPPPPPRPLSDDAPQLTTSVRVLLALLLTVSCVAAVITVVGVVWLVRLPAGSRGHGMVKAAPAEKADAPSNGFEPTLKNRPDSAAKAKPRPMNPGNPAQVPEHVAVVSSPAIAQLPLQPGASLATAVDSVRHAVVTVAHDASGFGSGFIVQRKRWVATNHHVVAGALSASVFRKLDGDDEPLEGKVEGFVACDPSADLVILALKEDWPAEPLQLSTTPPRLGDDVFAIGTPKGLTETITRGIVSQLRFAADIGHEHLAPATKIIQTDAFMTEGSSGGPLCSTSGQVLGINSFVQKNDNDNVEFHFAISVEELSRLVAKAGNHVRPLAELPRTRE